MIREGTAQPGRDLGDGAVHCPYKKRNRLGLLVVTAHCLSEKAAPVAVSLGPVEFQRQRIG